ncbi:MAG: trimethylamine methyltransferase family protein, partial [Anaerolineae bacterium]|nr:trimethylamine methyltransferase family protein [Anaerolineae bacterium]
RITLGASPYPQWVHDLESDRIVPYDTARLIEATRLTHVLGIVGRPGCPADVAPALQPVVQYWATACASAYARDPVDPKSHEALPYVMAMAEALGRPLTALPVYVFTPLALGSESLRCVFAAQARLSSVSVSSMPSLGLSAPIGLGDAFAVAAAEVIGAALVVEALTGLPTRWRVAVFPADLRALMMVFGSPENHLLQLASEEVDAYLHGRAWRPYAVNMHTNAKRPGAQASAEKASQMTSGALLGARHFYPAGTLSLDEAFSAEQLIYDVEIVAHVERLVRGVDASCDPNACVDVVREGLAARGFLGLEDTVARYRQVYWHPELFQRGSLASWMGRGAPRERDQAAARVGELLTQHDYELEPELRRELDAILARARERLG